MQRALDSAIGLPSRSTSALSMVALVMAGEVRRNLNGCSFARGVGGASLRETHQRRTNHRSPEPSGEPLFSDRSLVTESVERGRIDDPTGEVGAVSPEPLDHESVVGDLRMRGDEAERACLLEAEASVVRGKALDYDGRLACFFGAAERVPDQPCS